MSVALSKIKVRDDFGAATDPDLPTVSLAINPAEVEREFKRGLPRLGGDDAHVIVKSITVTRHKPGKRCVVEYDVRVERPDGTRRKSILLGKIRARRFGNEAYRLLDALWNAGFRYESPDKIAVPEPIGVVPRFHMWLQQKVPGTISSVLLAGPDGVALARRIAEAIHKLHRAGILADRTHTMGDELRILHECLGRVTAVRPEWSQRLEHILAASDRLGSSVPLPKACGIHRDFYPAQVIVRKRWLYLIDFDLYCQGDPGLDAGNFIGHMIEESVRTHGHPGAWTDRERAIEDRFVELSGERVRPSVHAYTTLTLVRHIYLSTQFPERRAFTESLMELCENRLGIRPS